MLTYADVCRQSVLLQKRERQEGTAGRGMRVCGRGEGDGGGRVCGFWHIMTLASDWAEQAREAMHAFESLSAARCASI